MKKCDLNEVIANAFPENLRVLWDEHLYKGKGITDEEVAEFRKHFLDIDYNVPAWLIRARAAGVVLLPTCPEEEGVIWLYGIWHGGVWEGSVWMHGEWRGGVWKGGKRYGGAWCNGTWENGDWYGGDFLNGHWEDGTFHEGTIHDVEWHYGKFLGGTWKGGVWEDGEFTDRKDIIIENMTIQHKDPETGEIDCELKVKGSFPNFLHKSAKPRKG